MSRMLSFDPGLREAGFAVWENGKLVRCGAIYADSGSRGVRQWWAMANTVASEFQGVDEYAFETMSTRKGKEAAHGNLFELTLISGLVGGMLRATLLPTPANRWTHRRNKEQNAAVTRQMLTPEEREVLEAALKATKATNHKEVTDAVGIGLYNLKRWM